MFTITRIPRINHVSNLAFYTCYLGFFIMHIIMKIKNISGLWVGIMTNFKIISKMYIERDRDETSPPGI